MGLIISANYDLILWGRNFKYVIVLIIFVIFAVIYQYSDTSSRMICEHDLSPWDSHIQTCSKHVYLLVSCRFLTVVLILKSPRQMNIPLIEVRNIPNNFLRTMHLSLHLRSVQVFHNECVGDVSDDVLKCSRRWRCKEGSWCSDVRSERTWIEGTS